MSGKLGLGRRAAFLLAMLPVLLCFPFLEAAAEPSAGQDVIAESVSNTPVSEAKPDELAPERIDPYTWSAQKAVGGAIVINGHAPDTATKARLFEAAGSRALDASSVAIGAPNGFADDAMLALTILLALDEGRAELVGAAWRLIGKTDSVLAGTHVSRLISDANLEDAPWQLALTLPAKPASDADAMSSNDAEETEPDDTALEIDIADNVTEPDDMSEPVAPETIKDAKLSEDVIAETSALEDNVDDQTDESETQPAPAAPLFTFAARKQSSERWLLGGSAPIAAFQRYIAAHFQVETGGELIIAPAPDGFAATAMSGMEALNRLEIGHLLFDGANWHLSGVAGDEDIKDAIETTLADTGIASDLSIAAPKTETPLEIETKEEPETQELALEQAPVAQAAEPLQIDEQPDAVSEPEPETAAPEAVEVETAPEPIPLADPYTWSATLLAKGGIGFSGYVPNEALDHYLDTRAGSEGHNTTKIATGAPESFARDILAALDALAPLDAGTVTFDGTIWALMGNAETASAKAQALAALGDRAENWSIAITAPAPPPPVDKGAPDYAFSAQKLDDGTLMLAGDIPAEATRAYLGVLTSKEAVEALNVRPGAPQGFVRDVVAGLRALVSLESGQLSYEDFAWTFSGKSASDVARAAARADLAALPGPPEWRVEIVAPSPFEICTRAVTAFDARNPILFNAGIARIAAASLPALDEIAIALNACPETIVHVEGHTDSDGDETSNLILSVARAEAVVAQLVDRGVAEARLYAIGYGESLPIASNETRDGKRRNRRIVLNVIDGDDDLATGSK